jgi:hypothetical protein
MSIERLKELEAKATPGPWLLATSNGGFIVEFDGNYVLDAFVSDVLAQDKQRANAKLIAEMRNALPKLLAVVEAGDELARAFPEAIAVLQREGYKDTVVEFKEVWRKYLKAKAEL